MKRTRFRRSTLQPLAPGLPVTSSSHKRPPLDRPTEARNHEGLCLNRFRRNNCSNGPGSMTKGSPPLYAPFRRKVRRRGFASGQAVLPDREAMCPKAHRIMASLDKAWRKPVKSQQATSRRVIRGYLQLLPVTHPSQRKKRIPASPAGGPGHRCLLLWFPGNPQQEDQRASKPVKITPSSKPLPGLEIRKSVSDRSR
jgi:hypothetical protein